MEGTWHVFKSVHPHKLNERVRRLVRATRTPLNTLKRLQVSATKMGETLQATVAQILQSKLI